jgi:hypothetical protein
MFTTKAFFVRAMLALALAVGASSAMAEPYYRVTLDTSEYAGTSGFLDFGYNGPGDAGLGLARVVNLSGDFVGDPVLEGGAVGDVVKGIELTNKTGYNFFDQKVNFTDALSFDIYLDPLGGTNGLVFSVALLNANFSAYLGGEGNLLEISVLPGVPAEVIVVPGAPADVVTVPEPRDWALVLTGLLLIRFTRRLQQRR